MLVKTKEDLLTFLEAHIFGTLATVGAGNTPHATAIYYHVDKELNFYFLTKDMTAKFTNIKDNQNIALVITDEASLQMVQLEGKAREVDYAKPEYAPIMKDYVSKLSAFGKQWEKLPLNHVAEKGYFSFIKITPTSIHWTDFTDWGHTLQYEQRFDESV